MLADQRENVLKLGYEHLKAHVCCPNALPVAIEMCRMLKL